MIPINNSDLAWLVVSDYNQDNDILGAEELREDIYNPETNQWINCVETVGYQSGCVGSCLVGYGTALGPSVRSVGSACSIGKVGEEIEEKVGGGILTAGPAKRFEDNLIYDTN